MIRQQRAEAIVIVGTAQDDPASRPAESRGAVLTSDGPLALHPLTYLEQDGEVVVGRADIDSYGVFPPDGADLLRQLSAGVPPAQAASWYADTYGEQVDIAEFLETLDELGFIGEPGTAAAGPVRWQRLGRWMFSPVAWACYVLVIAAAVAAMVAKPRLAPHPGNVIFTHYLTVLELVVFLGQFPFILLHEWFHMLAGRRLGLHSSLRIGRRLYFLVFETALDGLVAVPRRKRYLPMLAGMLADLLVIAVLTLIAAALIGPGGKLPLIGAVCLAQAFVTLLRFAWQFYVYLRTDLYCVTVTVLGCLDLDAAARRILANRFRRLLRRPAADESLLHPRDRAVGRWYSWLMLAGYAFSIVTLVVAIAPLGWRILGTAFARFAHGGQPWAHVADSVLFLALNLAQIAIVLILMLRSRRRRDQSRGASSRPEPILAAEQNG
jgi:hypothetical protein